MRRGWRACSGWSAWTSCETGGCGGRGRAGTPTRAGAGSRSACRSPRACRGGARLDAVGAWTHAPRGFGPLLARSLAVVALAAARLRRVMSVVVAVSLPFVRVVLGAAGDLARYRAGRWRASLGWGAMVWLGLLAENGDLVTAVVLVSCGPVVVAGVWRRVWPVSFERVAAPVRRLVWWVWVRRHWAGLARDCGLSVQRKRRQRALAWQSKKAPSPVA